MAPKIGINAEFNVDDKIYKATMTLPNSAPTGIAPFVFEVTSALETTPTVTTPLLTVAVGAANQVYIGVEPPRSLISAVAGDIVKELDVVVAEGTYNRTAHQFES